MTDSEVLGKIIDYPYNDDVLKYINFINEADYDVVIFMARKMYCLYMAVIKSCENLHKQRENRLVIQHNALPFFKSELAGKRILLCDDVALSATAIKNHRKLLLDVYGVKEENIGVSILFAKTGLEIDFDLVRMPIYLEYGKIRELSRMIVSFIWSTMTPYVAFLPSFKVPFEELPVVEKNYNNKSSKWKQTEMEFNDRFLPDIRAYCYTLIDNPGKADLACVRIYYDINAKSTIIVPFVMLPSISTDSLRRIYDRCAQEFGLLPLSEDAEETDAAKLRLISYIFSGDVLKQFTCDFALDINELEYRNEPDNYSFPESFKGLGSKLLNYEKWDYLWEQVDRVHLSDDLKIYMKEDVKCVNDDGVGYDEIIEDLEKADNSWKFFGIMSQYDKKTQIFDKGVPEAVLRKVIRPNSIYEYFTLLISYLDRSVATMNTHILNNTAYSYFQKGEQACRVFMDSATISSSALSVLYNSIESERWNKHLETITSIYSAYKKRNEDAVLDELLFSVLSKTGVDGFYVGNYYDLHQNYEERAGEIEYFSYFSQLIPEYLDRCEDKDSSVEGFIKYINDTYPDDDSIKSFAQEVSCCAV